MKLEEVIELLTNKAPLNLPGIEAQYKLAPYTRRDRGEAKEKDLNPRISAVMALLYQKQEEAHFLLMKRNTYKGVHSAQIGFPGGKRELEDKDLINTALRETQEEMGINPKIINVIRQLTEVYIPPSRFLVHPFLGYTKHNFQIIPDPIEVAGVIELPLSQLLNDGLVRNKKISLSNGTIVNTPCFEFENDIIWGATAMMLSEIKELIKELK